MDECDCGHERAAHNKKTVYRHSSTGLPCECGCADWLGCSVCDCTNYRIPEYAPSEPPVPTANVDRQACGCRHDSSAHDNSAGKCNWPGCWCLSVHDQHVHVWSYLGTDKVGLMRLVRWMCVHCPATVETRLGALPRCQAHHTHDVWMSSTGPRCAICGHPLDGTMPTESPPARTILGWQRFAYAYAKRKGFYDGPMNFGEQVALMHRELSEALEEWCNHHEPTEIYENQDPEKLGKPEGIPIEFADTILRVMQWAEHLGIDLESAMVRKMAYNETRPYRHGKRI